MQLVISFLFLMVISPFINAQDTLEYRSYIDYERRDHLAMTKNTIITRDGKFLADASYCFAGNKKDFDFLLKSNRTLRKKNDLIINNKSELYLIGEIKDSIKAGVWILVIKNTDIRDKRAIIDSVRIENYLPIGGPKEARYRYYNTNMKCNIQPSNYYQDIRCRDSINNISFSEQNISYKERPDIGRYMRSVSCQYLAEREKFVREREEWEKYKTVLKDYIYMSSKKEGDTIKTHFRVDTHLHNHIFVEINIIEVIRNDKLVYFNIEEYRNLPEKIKDEFKEYNFYPEIMYNLAPCWKLGR